MPEPKNNDGSNSNEMNPARHRVSLTTYIIQETESFLVEINWRHIGFKIVAYIWFIFILSLSWWTLSSFIEILIPVRTTRSERAADNILRHFEHYKGYHDCQISIGDVYNLPESAIRYAPASATFCSTRTQLLQALSNGGRIGFDTPYIPQGCHYRWFTTTEICFILERFDEIIFVGDSFLHTIYNGLTILLRRDLATGALLPKFHEEITLKHECHCDHQFLKARCADQYITSSRDADDFACPHTRHTYLKASSSSPSDDVLARFQSLVPQAPRSNYKPIPIVHSLAPSTADHQEASRLLSKILSIADASKRKTPILWIGPTAAGHIEVRGRKGNQEIWDYNQQMTKYCRQQDIEVLGMWNMTVQASSWDGMHFGEQVAITQAMMVINWLSRLQSS